jgi:zinc carboxypeptidase
VHLRLFAFCMSLVAGLSLGLSAQEGAPAAAPPLASRSFQMRFFGATFPVDAKIPTLVKVLRKDPGQWHLRHDEIRRYFDALAAASERVTVQEIGVTWEGRPLFLAIITDPANHARLDEIRKAHLELSEDPNGEHDLHAQKLVAWLGYSVHGDESSAANAAPLVGYRLAADTSKAMSELLRDTVVIIDPCLNPDGLDRFAQWANTHRGQKLAGDPEHREHRQAWPSGRTNHYWFDLNRDWLLAQHPESKARLNWFHRWRPNVLTDHHEMGSNSTFFFQPGVPSRTNPLTPPRNQDLTRLIAKEHAKALDGVGTPYYSEQGFDDFYYGKGSTYPDVNGGVGILFEQASSRGHLQETVNGPLRFPDTIANQVVVSFSTLKAAQAHRFDLLDWQRTFYREARFAAAADPVKAYVFGDAHDPVRSSGMVRLLERHRIRVATLEEDFQQDGQAFLAGQAFAVEANQPQYRLIRSLFERRLSFEDPTFYDVSAWNLPMAYDVPFAEVPEGEALMALREVLSLRPNSNLAPDVRETTDSLGKGFIPDHLHDDYGRTVSHVTPLPKVETTFSRPESITGPGDVALALDWRDSRAFADLARLLEEGFRVRVATSPFRAKTAGGEMDFAAGSVLIPLGDQGWEGRGLRMRLERALKPFGRSAPVHRVLSGLTPLGPDLGSSDFAPLVKPEIALLIEGGVSAYDAGEFWHLLDARLGLPVTLLSADRLEGARLDRYTHLIMPGGRYGNLDGDAAAKVKTWVRAGGVLIATEGACAWAAREILDIDPKAKSGTKTRSSSGAKDPGVETKQRWGDRSARRAQNLVAGTIFRGLIDPTHPLGFGYDDGELFLFKTSASVMARDSSEVNDVCVYPSKNPRVAGYASKRNDARIAGSAAVNHRRLGRGAVVRILDDPAFRAYWWGGFRLVANAIFYARFADATDGDEDDVDSHGHGHGH